MFAEKKTAIFRLNAPIFCVLRPQNGRFVINTRAQRTSG
jgi:hypothetical protein